MARQDEVRLVPLRNTHAQFNIAEGRVKLLVMVYGHHHPVDSQVFPGDLLIYLPIIGTELFH